MEASADKIKEKQSRIQRITNEPGPDAATMEDNRPSTVYQRQLQQTMDDYAATKAVPLQRKTGPELSRRPALSLAEGANRTGLPDHLKTGIEHLSGYAMDDVKVHYNSAKPAQLQAHAYAQGTDIHLAPGQEKHLPHEAWHVVQQKQGRVKPTMQFKSDVRINDDAGLEKEADVMGKRALHTPTQSNTTKKGQLGPRFSVLQKKIKVGNEEISDEEAFHRNKKSRAAKKKNNNGITEKQKKSEAFKIVKDFGANNRQFTNIPALKEAVKKSSQLMKLINVNKRPTIKTYLTNQEKAQNLIKNDTTTYPSLFTTVGFEHEFGGMQNSPLAGVSHLIFAKSDKEMPLTKIPFKLETDASNAIEFVSPPFILPMHDDKAIPIYSMVQNVDTMIRKLLLGVISTRKGSVNFEKLLANLSSKTGWKFSFLDDLEIKSEHLSMEADLKKLSGFLQAGKLKNNELKKFPVDAIEKFKGRDVPDNILSQINFAADIDVVNKFISRTGYIGPEPRLFYTVDEKLKEHLGIDDNKRDDIFGRLLLDRLTSLIAVPAQQKLSEMQKELLYPLLDGPEDEIKIDAKDQDEFRKLANMISFVKRIRVSWIKDHFTSLAAGMSQTDKTKKKNIKRLETFLEKFEKEEWKKEEVTEKDYEYFKKYRRNQLTLEQKRLKLTPEQWEVTLTEEEKEQIESKLTEELKELKQKQKRKKPLYENMVSEEYFEEFKKIVVDSVEKLMQELSGSVASTADKKATIGGYGHDFELIGSRQDTFIGPGEANILARNQRLHVIETDLGELKQAWK